ncbi:unnamed protein product, partial [Gulo gulo]
KLAFSTKKRKQRKGLERLTTLNPAPYPVAAAILVRAGLFPASSAGLRGPRRPGGCHGNGSILGRGGSQRSSGEYKHFHIFCSPA